MVLSIISPPHPTPYIFFFGGGGNNNSYLIYLDIVELVLSYYSQSAIGILLLTVNINDQDIQDLR